jgi:hypothetical protein
MPKDIAKATTFRIEPVTMNGLEKLSAILNRPLNKLANEAMREYVARRISEVELELTSTLDELRAYRLSDPEFAQSFDKFIDAEMAVAAKDDPAEGRVFVEKSRAGTAAKVGPAQTALLKVLNG